MRYIEYESMYTQEYIRWVLFIIILLHNNFVLLLLEHSNYVILISLLIDKGIDDKARQLSIPEAR
jgi:hypothetical protein